MRPSLWVLSALLVLALTPIALAGGNLDFHSKSPHALVGACLVIIALVAAVWLGDVSWSGWRLRLDQQKPIHTDGFQFPRPLARICVTGPPAQSILQVFQH